jgi:hypothetical protein
MTQCGHSDSANPYDTPVLSENSIRPVWIRTVEQNHRIIESDVCDPARTWHVGCRPYQVAVSAFSEMHLRRILSAYAAYYNQARTHLALQKDAPVYRAVQRSGDIVAIPILGGVRHQYVRM